MTKKPETSVNELVDHLFRHNSGQMVAILTRIFGFENIDLVEDAIQEALIKALKQWQFKGVPQNPNAWMIQVAKNYVLDQFRRNKKIEKTGDDSLSEHFFVLDDKIEDKLRYPKELNEDLLCMMFATCHPMLTPDSQIALTLKTVGGFSVSEIAAAFLGKKDATAKMLTRAKQTLLKNKVKLSIPPPDQLQSRLDAVLKILYLMFNEGYNASSGESLIRHDLCYEAIRLTQKLSDHPVAKSPKIHALLALFFFQAARLETRQNESQDILPLAKQQRGLWDKKLINVGLYHFKQSAKGDVISDYHLEAEIASCHILANDFDSTDWKRILDCYEKLLERKYSPVVDVNRIFVLSKIVGAKAALQELEDLRTNLPEFFPLFVAIAQLQYESESFEAAIVSYRKAIRLTQNQPIKLFLGERIEKIKRKAEYLTKTQ